MMPQLTSNSLCSVCVCSQILAIKTVHPSPSFLYLPSAETPGLCFHTQFLEGVLCILGVRRVWICL